MTNLQHALEYVIGREWSVIPVGTNKHPLIPAWAEYQKRRPTEDEVREWWTKWPAANIAVITGKVSNLSILDVDWIDKADHSKGLAPFEDLPHSALMATSGSGGRHFLFAYTPQADGRKTLREHIDIKSEGGYLIIEPSVHESGGQYRFDDAAAAPSPFPAQLLQERTVASTAPTRISDKGYWQEVQQGMKEGGRNNKIASISGVCFDQNWTEQETVDYLVPFGLKCEPPVSIEEIARTVNSVYRTAQSRKQNKDARETSKIEIVALATAADEEQAELGENVFPMGLQGPISGAPGHLKWLDPISEKLQGGMRIKDVGVVAGHTGKGKTLIAQVITAALVGQGEKVLWFEFEVGAQEMRERFSALGVSDQVVYVPRDVETKSLDGAMEFVEAAIIKAKQDLGIRWVILDLLDYLRPRNDKERRNVMTNMSNYITQICMQLKNLARDKNVGVILLAHTRKPAPGQSQRPNLYDIGNSGGVATNANWVLLVHRYTLQELSGGSSPRQGRPGRNYDAGGVSDPDEPSNTTGITLAKARRGGEYITIEIDVAQGKVSPSARTAVQAAVEKEWESLSDNPVDAALSEDTIKPDSDMDF